MRVSLIPTGRMELKGLAPALARLFPDHEFVAIAADRLGNPYAGFTSARLPLQPPRNPGPRSPAQKLAARLAAELTPESDEPADLAIVIDDLELLNADQPEVVSRVFRDAVEQHVRTLERLLSAPQLDRIKGLLGTRASFHLAVPMIEAWLFADPVGPERAGVPAERPWKLVDACDPEQFETDDAAYRGDDGAECQSLRGALAPWVALDRHRHPKKYLQWLCRAPGEKDCTGYQESHGGAAALSSIDWPSLLWQTECCRYVRSLLVDISEALQQEPVGVSLLGERAALTSIYTRRAAPVLRNL
jgi:hypothetical protein